MKVNRLFKRSVIAWTLFLLFTGNAKSQSLLNYNPKYYPEKDSLVIQTLKKWQELKFGLMITWGPYSQWGIVESWSLCPEDNGWNQRIAGTNPQNFYEYRKEYENLKRTFNPEKFDPENWAKAARDAGMKYVVAMAKHHDGFCMFDTKTTDYKITSKECPFSINQKADVVKEILNAFSKEEFWTGVYFSKPDWNDKDFWDPYFPPFDRNVNYDPDLYPEKWEKFVERTHDQIMELITGYGKINILWFDGGWVAKQDVKGISNYYEKVLKNANSGFVKEKRVNQDLRMDELVRKIRDKQPGVIVVDRFSKDVNENYLTPEQWIPEKMIPFPWESCITATSSWSYKPNDVYKPTRQIVHALVDIVSKGGNLLLNIGPRPDGDWEPEAYISLKEIGDWMHVNDEAIYETQPIEPWKEGKICLTKKKNTEIVYAIYLADESETVPPSKILLNSIQPAEGSKVTMLGVKGNLKWQKEGKGFAVYLPESLSKRPPCKHAWTIKISKLAGAK